VSDSERENCQIAQAFSLSIVALFSPVLYWVGLLTRGVSFFYLPMAKLAGTYLLMAAAAVAAVWLLLRPPRVLFRILAVVALLVNLGGIIYAGRLWRADARLLTSGTLWTPFEEGKLGIVIAPAGDSAQALAVARTIEETIRQQVSLAGLDGLIETRQVTSLSTVKAARHVAQRMQACVIIWGAEEGSELRHTKYYVTSLGARLAASSLEPSALMMLLVSDTTLALAENSLTSEGPAVATAKQVIVPAALGFATLAGNQPLYAASFFQVAQVSQLQPAVQSQLAANYALALLYANRADLAADAVAAADPAGNLQSALVAGTLALVQNDSAAAEDAFLAARILDAHSAQAYCGLGIIEASRAKLDRASALYNQALTLEPGWGIIQLLRAQVFELRGDVEGARTAYDLAGSSLGPFGNLRGVIRQRVDQLAAAPPAPVATATIAATPSPMSVPGQRQHVVTRNQTIREIAGIYGVSEEDLIQLNKLEDRNTLFIGQVLVIPDE